MVHYCRYNSAPKDYDQGKQGLQSVNTLQRIFSSRVRPFPVNLSGIRMTQDASRSTSQGLLHIFYFDVCCLCSFSFSAGGISISAGGGGAEGGMMSFDSCQVNPHVEF